MFVSDNKLTYNIVMAKTTMTIQEQIAALRAALADNRLEVTIGDARVRYRSVGEILAAMEKLEAVAAIETKGASGSRNRAVSGRRFL